MIPGSLAMPAAAAAAPSFSPSELFSSGQKGVWFDASAWASSAFQDTAGSTPVTATGQSIARLADLSGRGNHVTQSTSGFRPTLELSSGLYGILGDGSDDRLTGPAISNVINNNGWEAFIAFRFSSVSTNSASPYANQSILADVDGWWEVGFARTSGVIGAGGGSTSEITATQSATLTDRHVLHARYTGSNLIVSLNGGGETSVSCSNFIVSGALSLLRAYGASTSSNARLHEAIVSGPALTTEQRANCIGYLKSKWGVA